VLQVSQLSDLKVWMVCPENKVLLDVKVHEVFLDHPVSLEKLLMRTVKTFFVDHPVNRENRVSKESKDHLDNQDDVESKVKLVETAHQDPEERRVSPARMDFVVQMVSRETVDQKENEVLMEL